MIQLWAALGIYALSQSGGSEERIIRASRTFAPHTRIRQHVPDGRALVRVTGANIVVDFKGAVIRSAKDELRQRDTLEGTGILVENARNVVLRNVDVQGFRFNVRVVRSQNVRVENISAGNSRAIRMLDGGRPVNTFLVLRDAEAWRGYGAGIWLERSENCRVSASRAAGGTIGLAMVDCLRCEALDNDFSFCGGWGVAMSRTRESVVAWNHLDFDNRVWGGGWGADSAAMGMADDCDRNYVVGNSMTHGGDGFFLSNRNDVGPVDPKTGYLTPEGGSDHNIVAFNDGSWSPANAFEGTFSVGNVYYRNIADDSGFGFWLGFSSESQLIENEIFRNRSDGIAIEQGRGTQISGNRFEGNAGSAIHLWAGNQKERSPFPSTHIDLSRNEFRGSGRRYQLEGSSDVAGDPEAPASVRSSRVAEDAARAFERSPEFTRLRQIVALRPKRFVFYRDSGQPTGLQWIQPEEFGPRDFRGKAAHYRLIDPATAEIMLLELGASLSVSPGATASPSEHARTYIVRATSGSDGVGEERIVEVKILGPKPMTVPLRLRSGEWSLKWFSWKGMSYDDHSAWRRLFASAPLRAEQAPSIGGEWSGRSPAPGVPSDHFALAATTKVRVPAGTYAFSTLSDDGIRVFVDGKMIIERWDRHGGTEDRAELALDAGVHEIVVQYCQESGGAVLGFDWQKVGAR